MQYLSALTEKQQWQQSLRLSFNPRGNENKKNSISQIINHNLARFRLYTALKKNDKPPFGWLRKVVKMEAICKSRKKSPKVSPLQFYTHLQLT